MSTVLVSQFFKRFYNFNNTKLGVKLPIRFLALILSYIIQTNSNIMKKLGFIFAFSTLFVLGVSAQTVTKPKPQTSQVPAATTQPASATRSGTSTSTPATSTNVSSTAKTSTDTPKPKPSRLTRKNIAIKKNNAAPAAAKKTE